MQDYLHFVAPPNFRRIDSLHEQHIKKRRIVIAEDPGLHLVWYYDTIFIKPIPLFLLNFTTWRGLLLPPISTVISRQPDCPVEGGRTSYSVNTLDAQCKSAIGFLRTYSILIRHPSDYEIARSSGLIHENITYSDFRAFIKPFFALPESAVSQRYRFGQMRLTRLNWAVRLLQPCSVSTGSWFANKLYYQELYTQSGDYSVSWLPPLLFTFAALSVVLSAMQVVLAALGTDFRQPVVRFSWGFSISAIAFCILACSILLVYPPILLLGQAIYAFRGQKLSMQQAKNSHHKV